MKTIKGVHALYLLGKMLMRPLAITSLSELSTQIEERLTN